MKKYVLSYKKDKHFLTNNIKDSINETAFNEGDVVKVQCYNARKLLD